MYVSCTFECGHSVSFSICYSVLCSNPSDVDVILFPVINEPYVPSQISRIIKSFFIGKNKWLVLISASITLFSFRSYGCLFLSLSLRFALFSVLYPLRAPSPPLFALGIDCPQLVIFTWVLLHSIRTYFCTSIFFVGHFAFYQLMNLMSVFFSLVYFGLIWLT